MTRLLGYGLLLGVVQFLVGATISIFVFRDVDLRFHVFLQLLAIPLLQAAVVCIAAPDSARLALREAGAALLRNRLLTVVLAVDIVLLAAVFAITGWPASASAAVRSLVAAILLATVALRRPLRLRDRVAIALAAVMLLAVASAFAFRWLPLLGAAIPHPSVLVRWVGAYVPLFCGAVIITMIATRSLENVSKLAARLLDAAGFLAISLAVVVLGNLFWRPFLVDPWRDIARALIHLIITAAILGGVAALTERPTIEASK